jgi:hypothetical protein
MIGYNFAPYPSMLKRAQWTEQTVQTLKNTSLENPHLLSETIFLNFEKGSSEYSAIGWKKGLSLHLGVQIEQLQETQPEEINPLTTMIVFEKERCYFQYIPANSISTMEKIGNNLLEQPNESTSYPLENPN